MRSDRAGAARAGRAPGLGSAAEGSLQPPPSPRGDEVAAGESPCPPSSPRPRSVHAAPGGVHRCLRAPHARVRGTRSGISLVCRPRPRRPRWRAESTRWGELSVRSPKTSGAGERLGLGKSNPLPPRNKTSSTRAPLATNGFRIAGRGRAGGFRRRQLLITTLVTVTAEGAGSGVREQGRLYS